MKKRIDYKVFIDYNDVEYGFKTLKDYDSAAVLRKMSYNCEYLFQFLLDCANIDYIAKSNRWLLDNV